MNLDRPWQRLAGLLAIFVALALYDPASPDALHRLVIPGVMAVGAWALVQNLAAVALATAVLGFIHLEVGAEGWIDRYAYPLLTALAGLVFLGILIRRFRRRIVETRAARWSERGS